MNDDAVREPARRGPSLPRTLLHLEGATLLVVSVTAYGVLGGAWWLFLVLLLAPDLGMLGYLSGPRVGAMVYDLVHAYPLPAALLGLGAWTSAPFLVGLALIWFAHIGMDRAVGYGLKYASGFRDTHMRRV